MDLLKCLWALLVMGGKKTNNMLMETGGKEFLMIQWEKPSWIVSYSCARGRTYIIMIFNSK